MLKSFLITVALFTIVDDLCKEYNDLRSDLIKAIKEEMKNENKLEN